MAQVWSLLQWVFLKEAWSSGLSSRKKSHEWCILNFLKGRFWRMHTMWGLLILNALNPTFPLHRFCHVLHLQIKVDVCGMKAKIKTCPCAVGKWTVFRITYIMTSKSSRNFIPNSGSMHYPNVWPNANGNSVPQKLKVRNSWAESNWGNCNNKPYHHHERTLINIAIENT